MAADSVPSVRYSRVYDAGRARDAWDALTRSRETRDYRKDGGRK